MVDQAQKIYNSRYEKVKELGDGTFATVYLCDDLKSEHEGRRIDKSFLDLLKVIEDDTPEFEFAGSYYEPSKSQEEQDKLNEAVEVLSKLELLFPNNSKFESFPADDKKRQVAIKKSKLNAFNDRDGISFYALREIKILQTLSTCKHVVNLMDVFYSEKDQSISIVLEYLDTNVHDLLKLHGPPKSESDEEEERAHNGLPLDEIKFLFKQVLEGLKELHDNGVMHRDVKPDNLLFNNQEKVIKFADFGISKFYEAKNQTKQHTNNCVTRCYRPPEIFFGQRNYNGEKVDVWSAGCVLAEMLTSQILFPGTTDIEQLSKIFDVLGTPTVEDWPEVESLPTYLPFSPIEAVDLGQHIVGMRQSQEKEDLTQAIDLLSQLISLNPVKRPSPSEAFKHPFFN